MTKSFDRRLAFQIMEINKMAGVNDICISIVKLLNLKKGIINDFIRRSELEGG